MDEALGFFKANVLFKHFEVKGAADRVLIYLTLYTTQCLKRLETCATPADGLKALTAVAHENFTLPGATLGSPIHSRPFTAVPPPGSAHFDFSKVPCSGDYYGGDSFKGPRPGCPHTHKARITIISNACEPSRLAGCFSGDPGFSLGGFFPQSASSSESGARGLHARSLARSYHTPIFPLCGADLCRGYLKQVREELGKRLVTKVYDENGQPSKFWLVFAKRKFMNKTL